MRNGAAFSESVVQAPRSGNTFGYRSFLGMIPSYEYFVYMDDFIEAITTNVPTGWKATVIDTGATVVQGTAAGYGTGTLFFDSDGAAEGACVYGEKGIQLTAGKKFFMECRFQTETADDTDVQFGLSALTAVTNPEDIWTTAAADVVAFGVLDGSAVTGMLSDKADTGSVVQAGSLSMVSGSWHTLAIGYNGSTLTGWVDGNISLVWAGAAATIPTGVALAPFVGFRNGSAATNEAYCDYIRWVLER